MIPSFFKIKIFALYTKYSGSVTNGLTISMIIDTTRGINSKEQFIITKKIIKYNELFFRCMNSTRTEKKKT